MRVKGRNIKSNRIAKYFTSRAMLTSMEVGKEGHLLVKSTQLISLWSTLSSVLVGSNHSSLEKGN